MKQNATDVPIAGADEDNLFWKKKKPPSITSKKNASGVQKRASLGFPWSTNRSVIPNTKFISDVAWASWRLKPPASRCFVVQQLVQGNDEEYIKAPDRWHSVLSLTDVTHLPWNMHL